MGLGDTVNLNTNVGAGAGVVGQRLFNQGMSGLDAALDSYSTRVKNRAVNDLLQSAPTEGENADSYNARMRLGLSSVDGIDPLQALQLSKVASDPVYEREAKELAASQYDDTRGDVAFTQGIQASNLSETITQNDNTNTYRNNTTTETKRHNQVMESPTDIREAYSANYATGKRVDKNGKEHTFLTKDDFANYQQDKAKARFSQRVLDPSTIDKNKSTTIKAFDDILFKQLGEDGYKEYNKLPAPERSELLQYWLDNGVIDYGMTDENTFSSDDYGQGDASKGYSRQQGKSTVVQESGTVPSDIKYAGAKAFNSDGSRASKYDK